MANEIFGFRKNATELLKFIRENIDELENVFGENIKDVLNDEYDTAYEYYYDLINAYENGFYYNSDDIDEACMACADVGFKQGFLTAMLLFGIATDELQTVVTE